MAKTGNDPLKGFEKSADGNIVVNPVIGWQSFIGFGMSCGLRIETCHSDAHMQAVFEKREQPDAVQIVLSPKQARELAELLLRQAEQCLQGQNAADSH